MTFRGRIVLIAAAAVAAAVVAASLVVYFVVRDDLRGAIDEDLRRLASDVVALPATAQAPVPPRAHLRAGRGNRLLPAEAAATPGGGRVMAIPPPPPGRDGEIVETFAVPAPGAIRRVIPFDPLRGRDAYAQIVTAAGDRIAPLGPGVRLPVDRRVLNVARGRHPAYFDEAEIGGVHARILTQPVEPNLAIQTASSLEDADDTLTRLSWILLVVSAGGVALAAVLGLLVSRTALRPVARLAAAADQVAVTRDLSRRMEDGGEDELGDLARSFNTMLQALEHSVSAQRRLVTDASHELRTPLTSLRTNIEVLTRDENLSPGDRSRLLADVTAQMEELSKLADDLLALARAEEGPAPKAGVRLDEVVERAVDTVRRGTEDRVIELSLEETWVLGDASGLERAVSNLLDNALKWSPASGHVDVVLAEGKLTVTDDGPGVPPEDLPRIFDRFFRSSASRSTDGSGLGLAIVQRVAESHGGRAWADNADGRGARLHLDLPVAARPGD